jgi:hypothetical protein
MKKENKMKKATILAVLAMLLGFGCTRTLPTGEKGQMRIYELIVEDPDRPGYCGVPKIPFTPTHLKKNATEIGWCFTYLFEPGRLMNITIDSFVSQDDPGKKNPLGNNSDADNKFIIGPMPFRQTGCTKPVTPTKEGTFKYKVSATVERTDGTKQVLTLERAVIIDP